MGNTLEQRNRNTGASHPVLPCSADHKTKHLFGRCVFKNHFCLLWIWFRSESISSATWNSVQQRNWPISSNYLRNPTSATKSPVLINLQIPITPSSEQSVESNGSSDCVCDPRSPLPTSWHLEARGGGVSLSPIKTSFPDKISE